MKINVCYYRKNAGLGLQFIKRVHQEKKNLIRY